MASYIVNKQDFETKNEIEINGVLYEIPERTSELSEKIQGIVKRINDVTEYEYNKLIIEAILGVKAFQEIAPERKKTNADYLSCVQLALLNLFFEKKTEAEREEREKQAEMLSPVAEQLKALNPIISKISK